MMQTDIQIQDGLFAFKCAQVYFGFQTVTGKLSQESLIAINGKCHSS